MKQPARIILTYRDLAILQMVYAFDGCAIHHLKQRFFSQDSRGSACYRRIALLVAHGYLQATRLPAASGLGTGKTLLIVGRKGRKVLAEEYKITRSELKRQRFRENPVAADHHLAVCDVRLAFEQASEHSGMFTLDEWVTERQLRNTPVQVTDPNSKKSVVMVPDARFTLELTDGSTQPFYLEQDMGSRRQLQRLSAQLRGHLLRPQTPPIPVLFVVPDQKRLTKLEQIARTEAEQLAVDPTVIWFGIQWELTAETVLSGRIWTITGVAGAVSLAGVAGQPEQHAAETLGLVGAAAG